MGGRTADGVAVYICRGAARGIVWRKDVFGEDVASEGGCHLGV